MGKSKELATLTDVGGTIGDDLNIEVTDWGGLNVTQTTSNKDPLVKLISPTTNSWSHQMDSSAGDSLQWRYNNTTQMQIDASGRVTMPYQPSFYVALTNHYYTSNSASKLPDWSSSGGEKYNLGGHFSNGRFTAPVAGRYLMNYSGLHHKGAGTTGAWIRTYAMVNGVAALDGLGDQGTYGAYQRLSFSVIFNLSAADYVEMWAEDENGNNDNGFVYAGYTVWSGHLLG